jgi:ATP-dependent Clp protease adaptor protein ClpS
MAERHRDESRGEGQVATRERVKTKKPRMYAVVLLNDDYTPMEFVVWVLRVVFHKDLDDATRLMLDVHTKGQGMCGVFTFDVARSKATEVETLAAKNEHPLKTRLDIVETE